MVICLVAEKKVLLVYQADYALWQLSQGGIKEGEDVKETFLREVKEELGPEIEVKKAEIAYLGEERMEFSPLGKVKLQEKEGQANLKGKIFFAFAAPIEKLPSSLPQSQFQEHRLVTYQEGKELAATIPQTGKRQITESFLDILKEKGWIS